MKMKDEGANINLLTYELLETVKKVHSYCICLLFDSAYSSAVAYSTSRILQSMMTTMEIDS